METRITQLLGIRYPILQGAMAWITGWEIASAVSNAGGLGTIASATMEPDQLVDGIRRTRASTHAPFAVNIPIRLPSSEAAVEVAIAEKVPIVVLAAGDPMTYAAKLRRAGILVLQVLFSLEMADRSREAGVDAVIAMGVEAGGNLGPDELSTLVLVPQVVRRTGLPVVAAGGICDAQGFVAALALGAEGIQMGTRILATRECTVHPNYQDALIRAGDVDTTVTGRSTGLEFRVMKNGLAKKILTMEKDGRSREDIDALAIGGLRKAAVDGDVDMGSVMMGQVSGMISDVVPVAELFDKIMRDSSARLREMVKYVEP
ncbi:MAG: nitronate monooxygenase [Deltaproteobacteria bacterium]|nr:nitronate monooxygenase [Deltaproteobacteria bacterium]MBW1817843.1 nitronate monooxygenase [Deltaproteobacteria bacterium]